MTKCECEPCAFCGGAGYLWIDLLGNFTSYRPDDMAEIEDCDVCDGEGTIDFCDYCQAQEWENEMEREEQERIACQRKDIFTI